MGVLRITGIIALRAIGCAILGAMCVGAAFEATTCAVGGTTAGDVIFGGTISVQGAIIGGSVGIAIGCLIGIIEVCLEGSQRGRS
ncbi:hypothetical protein ACRYCC_43650 [Actinomadura scrupuli]|uniref:hypothetical protein n=1 Tax=Actinomadura scrupuli TaxID=559629 RepID=UPI003D999ADA